MWISYNVPGHNEQRCPTGIPGLRSPSPLPQPARFLVFFSASLTKERCLPQSTVLFVATKSLLLRFGGAALWGSKIFPLRCWCSCWRDGGVYSSKRTQCLLQWGPSVSAKPSLSPGCKSRELAWLRSTQCSLQERVLMNGNNTSIDSLHFRFEKNRDKNEWTHPTDTNDKSGFEFLYEIYSYTSLQKARCSAIPWFPGLQSTEQHGCSGLADRGPWGAWIGLWWEERGPVRFMGSIRKTQVRKRICPLADWHWKQTHLQKWTENMNVHFRRAVMTKCKMS